MEFAAEDIVEKTIIEFVDLDVLQLVVDLTSSKLHIGPIVYVVSNFWTWGCLNLVRGFTFNRLPPVEYLLSTAIEDISWHQVIQ